MHRRHLVLAMLLSSRLCTPGFLLPKLTKIPTTMEAKGVAMVDGIGWVNVYCSARGPQSSMLCHHFAMLVHNTSNLTITCYSLS